MIQSKQNDILDMKDLIRSEIKKLYNNLVEVDNSKISKKEMDLSNNKIYDEIEKKVIKK